MEPQWRQSSRYSAHSEHATSPAHYQEDFGGCIEDGSVNFLNDVFSAFMNCNSSSYAQEERCDAMLMQLRQNLDYHLDRLRSAPDASRPQVCSTAIKQLRRLERQAGTLLASLPPGSMNGSRLMEEGRSLQRELAAFEEKAQRYQKDLKEASPVTRGPLAKAEGLSESGRMLACRLDDLQLALDKQQRSSAKWVADSRVDRASADLEEFRIAHNGLSVEGAESGQQSVRLIRSLRGASRWYDMRQVQTLLERRNNYLSQCRFTLAKRLIEKNPLEGSTEDRFAAQRFLENHEDWEATLRETLGPNGSKDWKVRAQQALEKQRFGAYEAAPPTSMESGVLIIRRIRASKLPRSDQWDDIDPYVVFNFDGVERKTSVAWNSSAPEWRVPGRIDDDEEGWEEVSFEVNSLSGHDLLGIKIKNFDKFSADDDVGFVDVGEGGVRVTDILRGVFCSDRLRTIGSHFARDDDSRRDLPNVELCDDGTAKCHFPLRSLSGGRGTLTFDLAFDVTGASGDPLVLQPEVEDEALLMVGMAEVASAEYREEYRSSTQGFFLTTAGVSDQVHQQIPRHIADSVYEYNRLLDQLHKVTAEPAHFSGGAYDNAMLGEDSTETALLHERLDDSGAYYASSQEACAHFQDLLAHAQDIEARAQKDPLCVSAFTYQGKLLPSIGDWSIERRKALRNQVFMAKSHIAAEERRRRRPVASVLQRPAFKLSGCFLALIASAVLCSILVFNALNAWPYRNAVVLVALGLLLFALSCLLLVGIPEFRTFLFGEPPNFPKNPQIPPKSPTHAQGAISMRGGGSASLGDSRSNRNGGRPISHQVMPEGYH